MLSTPRRLDHSIIEHIQDESLRKMIHLHLFSTIDSTNQYLKELPTTQVLDVCCAEMQTQGRGRLGRHWHSPDGKNIYCSSRWYFDSATSLSGLSLVISLAVHATLKHFGLQNDIYIKWPNDIIWRDKKLAGILIETSPGQPTPVIIGIGLNVHKDDTKTTWCSLWDIEPRDYNRNLIIAQLLTQLHVFITRFKQHGLTALTQEWCRIDYLYGKAITLYQREKTITGVALGIDARGHLLCRDDSGKVHEISSGEATLHKDEG